MKIGWIGLGNIGTGMARRVLAEGHDLTAFARGVGQAEITDAGGQLSNDYRSLAATSDILGVCVFSDSQLEAALIQSGALAALRPGSVVVTHTTGSPTLARVIAQQAPDGVEALDACFSGGLQDTERGALTLMIGGTEAGIAAARPAMQCYASNIFHVGPAGAGQTAKLLNNLLLATNLHFAAEAMRMAAQQQLDPAQTARVIQQSSGSSMAMGMFTNGRTPEQALGAVHNYLVKDVNAARDAAQAIGVDCAAFSPIFAQYG